VAETNEFEYKDQIGQILVKQGLIRADQLAAALEQQKQNGKPVGQVLLRMGILTPDELARAHAAQASLRFLDLDKADVDPACLNLIDAAVAQKHQIIPVARMADGSVIVAVGTWTAQTKDVICKISTAKDVRLLPAIAAEAKVRAAIDRTYGAIIYTNGVGAMANSNGDMPPHPQNRPQSAVPAVMGQGQPGARNPVNPAASRSTVPAVFQQSRGISPPASSASRASDVLAGAAPVNSTKNLPGLRPDDIQELGSDQPVVIQFVNRILADAIKRGASDIHFEPRRDKLDIRFRVDGTMHFVDSVRRDFQAACTSRIKVMAEMNIAERRLPLDGRISVTLEGRSIDMRVSSLPTQYGESVVMRILDKGTVRPSIDDLGFSDRNLQILNEVIRKPHGIFLATGPTGSGKTTTLYGAIQAIHTPDVNIITVEDPVEYDLEGIRQSQVNEKAGLTFALQLRHILRHDPDIIYVGEIRDAETAEIAFRAALTGHMVFSTLHCNDASGAITRLLNMEMDPFLVSSSVVGVLAQRLVRRVCPHCCVPETPMKSQLLAFGIDPNSRRFQSARFVKAVGCEACDQSGYKGRYSVQELLVMDDDMRTMVLQGAAANKIRAAAMARGMKTMRDDAAEKIMQGITTFDEAQKKVYIEHSSLGDNIDPVD
jgi:general secretion pathway protein E